MLANFYSEETNFSFIYEERVLQLGARYPPNVRLPVFPGNWETGGTLSLSVCTSKRWLSGLSEGHPCVVKLTKFLSSFQKDLYAFQKEEKVLMIKSFLK